MLADIRGISGFLRRFAPAALDDLRARHPDAAAHLDPSGLPLGTKAEIAPAVDAALVMLDMVDGVASAAMTETVAKLKSTRRLELAGSVLALVASGGVVGATLGFDDTIAAAVLGIVGFVASAVPLVTGWLRGTATGQGSNILSSCVS